MNSIFFSYSHKDEALRDRLEVHLAALKRSGAITTWHDRRIVAGDTFSQRIDEQIENATIILLLVSPDFLASDYCNNVEMQRALARHAEGSARMIPVILRPCDWRHPPLDALLAAPTDGKPVTHWTREDDAFLDVVEHIRAALAAPGASMVAGARDATPSASRSAEESNPRSSNLRLRKQFTDADRDRFLDEAFAFIACFFRNSLDELVARNDGFEAKFKTQDELAFSAVIYRDGAACAQCTISMGNAFGEGIAYTASSGRLGNAYSEMLSVESDDQHLFLTLLGLSTMGQSRADQLSFEGAAEHYWSMLIAPLQR